MRRKHACVVSAFFSASLAMVVPAIGQQPPTNTAQAPDNTKVNKRDALSADSQKNDKNDIAITRNVRRAIVADKNLSTYAHNVKVITLHGEVTLKGPVRSEDKRKAVEAKAVEVAGEGRVANELTVATPRK